MGKARLWTCLCLVIFSGTVMLGQAQSQGEGKTGLVYWIPLNQTIEQGLTAYLERTFSEAEEAAADAIVVEMDTLGGEVNAALDIGKLIGHSDIPVSMYIKGEAISAGAYIALNADTIFMTPSSAIGAAEPRLITGETADPKTVAFWASNMRAAAEANGRDPDIAEAMVDRNIAIEGLTERGELVSLSANEAVEYGMADNIVQNQQDVLDEIGYPKASVVEMDMTPAERLARILTSPYVVPILFLIGLIGIGIELFTPGFGFPGVLGLLAFGLYFFGHFIAGFAGVETVALLVAGIVLILLELFVPGGILGVLGFIALMTGIIMAAFDAMFGIVSLMIAMVVSAVILVLSARYFGTRGTWRKLTLTDRQQNEAGYVSSRSYKELEGKRGMSVTPLRPSGIMMLDGKRYDVVSEGAFVAANQPVVVVQVEGSRIVVRPSGETVQFHHNES